ncbi:type II toxin-antitoxin system RelE/ParE family toxin [Pusillimonas sp. SM2304]|uniref:type II toxin-antitoxin system RelE/ParE family toxin n=1 Tax=Pusillimonas sp. SM2304 TaxID=3073241 RepID=UPI00287609E8|nr:type II toxin-antitoxin system RelE/ParE family toxin [Pusillimonas sp. SM2304]MDS1140081.1 type II toxin-antitoxin system RelE/ParE family toxin [Pusillimonas sp. SM2304]
MIESFKCFDTEALHAGRRVARFVNIERVASRKLRQMEIALWLDDLRIPPQNRLEALKGNRKGQYSIRINDQWRICFKWQDGRAYDVEIVDYH